MDIYLPADFRELHDAAPDDWRDMSTSNATHDRAPPCDAQRSGYDPTNACADPLWRVF